MVTVRSFNKKPGSVLARRSGPFASPRPGSEVTRSYPYGELEAGAEAGADAAAAAASEAAEEAAEAESAAEEAAAAAESAAAGADVLSVLAQPASASAARRALRASFVFIELYPEIEKGKR